MKALRDLYWCGYSARPPGELERGLERRCVPRLVGAGLLDAELQRLVSLPRLRKSAMPKRLRLNPTSTVDNQTAVRTGAPVSLSESCRALDVSDRRIEMVPLNRLTPYKGNPRTHSREQIRQIADSIKHFGFTNPILIDDAGEIIAGHGRVEAARLLALDSVPALRLSHLTAAQKRAYVLADNRLAEKARWDRGILAIELQYLIDLDFEVELTGFELGEIGIILDETVDAPQDSTRPADEVAEPLPRPTIARCGDVWLLGPHRLICGDDCDGIDTAIMSWQAHTCEVAVLEGSGKSFEEIQKERSGGESVALDRATSCTVEEVR